MQTEAKTLLRIEKFIIATGELPFDQRMNPEKAETSHSGMLSDHSHL
ncbi:hypothetical protein OW666_07855 [Acinetobacter baumannii]|nr:hypothetical protein [Acinetobacter baumannii]MDC4583249.1 hypothetical protein [Acinetobacter baumannii]MDK2128815.1 hypothetical protein [Acinetobacter baumannii]MDK2159246.1 hypothetical protein [Acinetobacter baumannii]MDK2166969.1 hypothetical protein [Acinetobacter baumannii]MDK2250283.1 hypothetical protein [Acinetobacter baumannii]